MKRVDEKEKKGEERTWRECKKKGEMTLCKKKNVNVGGW